MLVLICLYCTLACMNREVNARLEPGADGERRNFTIRHTALGDIRLDFWSGETKPSLIRSIEDDDTIPYALYCLQHTKEDFLMASLMGYLARINTAADEARTIFQPAIDIIHKTDLRYADPLSTWAEEISEGASNPWYDIPERGWYALTGPLPRQPGVRLIGGTAIYTTDSGELVIAAIADEDGDDLTIPVEHATYLTKPDIQPIATAIAKISLGESVANIRSLFDLRFKDT